MKTTVDIPDDILKDVMRMSEAKTKKDAIILAMQEYIAKKKMASMSKYLGTFETLISQKELADIRKK